jgi:hypothetical protein
MVCLQPRQSSVIQINHIGIREIQATYSIIKKDETASVSWSAKVTFYLNLPGLEPLSILKLGLRCSISTVIILPSGRIPQHSRPKQNMGIKQKYRQPSCSPR